MSETLLAKRYAQALFDLSLETDRIEQVKADMELLTEVIRTTRPFMLFLKSPVIRNEKKLSVIDEIFGGKVEELTEKFFRLVIKQKRENYLDRIAEQFHEIYKDHHHIVSAHVITPVRLTDELREKITQLVSEHTGGTVDLTESVDEGIIGGFIVKFNDMQYDASLLNQLNELKKRILI